MRSLIAYQQLLRFNDVQRSAWSFLAGDESADSFLKHYNVYVEEWKSPSTFSDLVRDNLRYGYFWVFAIACIVFGWAFYSAHWWGRSASITLLGIALAWEALTLPDYIANYISLPSEDQQHDLGERSGARAP
jgi:hypothetical protein